MIREVIVVEGRDDEAAVKRAVDAETIATHGYGISRKTFDLIAKAYTERGIIIFTDPDFAGDQIRKRLSARFPDGKHAFLPRENASPEDIRAALEKIRHSIADRRCEFALQDLFELGLAGVAGSAECRDRLGKLLGIGYGNTKVFLNRLNQYGVERNELLEAVQRLSDKDR